MQTARQILHDIANHPPARTVFVDATYALSIRQKLDQGWRDLDAGRTLADADRGRQLSRAVPLLDEPTNFLINTGDVK